jgi:hypothetical protein
MKKIIIILFTVTFFTACKKDKSNTSCNRLQQYSTFSAGDGQRDYVFEYNDDGTVKTQIRKVISNGFTGKYFYTYENNGQRITEKLENDNKYFTIYELNSSGQVGYSEIVLTDGVRKDTYTYDANGFLATTTLEYFKTGQVSPYLKLFINRVNTVDNGNLVKSVYTYKNVTTNVTDAPITSTWEYNLDKPSYKNIPAPGSINNYLSWYIGRAEPKISKNRVVKSDKSQLDYLTDENGNVTQINITDISGNPGPANNGKYTYKYQCN